MTSSSRRPIIAGNWKMNAAPVEARALALAVLPQLADFTGVESVLCPPFISLTTVREVVENSPVRLGAQDAFDIAKGAYTGAISAAMLAGLVDYVILGHSERRQYFGDTDESVDRKARAVLEQGMAPIICVGERLEERDAGRTEEVIRQQVQGGIRYLGDGFAKVVVAYEPVWAIGTGRAASPEQAQEVAALIRQELHRLYGAVADGTRIQYGGSVTPANSAVFFAQPDIDGALVGGASLKAAAFVAIVENAAGVRG